MDIRIVWMVPSGAPGSLKIPRNEFMKWHACVMCIIALNNLHVLCSLCAVARIHNIKFYFCSDNHVVEIFSFQLCKMTKDLILRRIVFNEAIPSSLETFANHTCHHDCRLEMLAAQGEILEAE